MTMTTMTTCRRFSSSPITIILALLLPAITACTAVDDDPAESAEAESDSDDITPGEECTEQIEQIMCAVGESFFSRAGDGQTPLTAIAVGDPDATVELSGGVLVQVSRATEFVGSQYFGNDDCTMGCSWCAPGHSLCHTGPSDPGSPGCGTCMPLDTLNLVEQCTELLEACHGKG
jgi:hypothetical protein